MQGRDIAALLRRHQCFYLDKDIRIHTAWISAGLSILSPPFPHNWILTAHPQLTNNPFEIQKDMNEEKSHEQTKLICHFCLLQ
ncbi:hypothetical protein BLX87_22445 [Bacillus sp. VT-16-64]|nr:hypothetical protein BLX87_22445 [Bacillus sp. VT-16-64]